MNIFFNEKEQRIRAGWRLFLQFVLMMLIFVPGAYGISFVLPNTHFLTSAAPLFIGVLISVWIAARYFDKRPFKNFGIHFNRLWAKEYLIGVSIAASAVVTIFLIEWSTGWLIVNGYGWNASANLPFGLGFFSYFLAMLMVGFHEELFSRGYHILNLTEGLNYQNIGTKGAIIIAVLLSSSLFGFLHASNPNASFISTFNIILAGIVLAIPFILTGRLALSAGLHFSWNFVMGGILGFPVSGNTIQFTVLNIQQNGNPMWTGGDFGPEAGIIGLVGMAIMLGLSVVYIRAEGHGLTIAGLFTERYQPVGKPDEHSP
jgi:membrane protease YdiL (CAAX protease family)